MARLPPARFVLLLALALPLVPPSAARAYGVVGGARLERLEVGLAYDGTEEVLTVIPRWTGSGRLFVPVPGDSELVEATAHFQDSGKSAELGGPKHAVIPKAPPHARAQRPGVQLPDLTAAPRLEAPPAALHLGAEAIAQALGADRSALPEAALAVYLEKGYGLLELALPATQTAAERAPVAVRFQTDRALVPVRLYAGTPHTLAITATVATEALDLGGMDAALGLRRDGPSAAPSPALLEDVRGQLDSTATYTVHRLVAPGLDGTRVGKLTVDLGLFPESEPAPTKPEATPKAPAARPKSGSGCGCTAGAPDGAVWAFLLVFLAGIRRRL